MRCSSRSPPSTWHAARARSGRTASRPPTSASASSSAPPSSATRTGASPAASVAPLRRRRSRAPALARELRLWARCLLASALAAAVLGLLVLDRRRPGADARAVGRRRLVRAARLHLRRVAAARARVDRGRPASVAAAGLRLSERAPLRGAGGVDDRVASRPRWRGGRLRRASSRGRRPWSRRCGD